MVLSFPLLSDLPPDPELTATKAMKGSICKMFHEVKVRFFGLLCLFSIAVQVILQLENHKFEK